MRRAAFFSFLLLASSPALAGESPQIFGKWLVNTTGPTAFYAMSVNDSAHVFGQWCELDEGRCVWLLGISTACEKGHRYPVLVNSDAGSAATEAYCAGPLSTTGPLAAVHRYAFANFDTIAGLIASSSRIGFAFPLQGDQFRVVRFDLNGAVAALSAMRAAAAARVDGASRKTTDERL